MKKHKKIRRIPSKIPSWTKKIPLGSHGSGELQKRLWRITSDFVRIRDYMKYGRCIATDALIEDWNQGQAGHYRRYTSCNGMFKFHPINLHLQTARSNSWPDSEIWETFNRNLKKRYGDGIIDHIDEINAKTPIKITTDDALGGIEEVIQWLRICELKPPYWERLLKAREDDCKIVRLHLK